MTPSQRIIAAVTSWPGVVAGPGPHGNIAFRVGDHEIGHLHGDWVAHVAFARADWEELLYLGRVDPRPIDHEGWASVLIEDESDVREAIDLLRLEYELIEAVPERLPAGPWRSP